MKPRLCICCGEPMAAGANSLSRNPNVCASCSSMADGMDFETCSDGAPGVTEIQNLVATPQEPPKHREPLAGVRAH